jgi:hypothetical protein
MGMHGRYPDGFPIGGKRFLIFRFRLSSTSDDPSENPSKNEATKDDDDDIFSCIHGVYDSMFIYIFALFKSKLLFLFKQDGRQKTEVRSPKSVTDDRRRITEVVSFLTNRPPVSELISINFQYPLISSISITY